MRVSLGLSLRGAKEEAQLEPLSVLRTDVIKHVLLFDTSHRACDDSIGLKCARMMIHVPTSKLTVLF